MPRLISVELLPLVARHRLLELFEADAKFVEEWDALKESFISVIERIGAIDSLSLIELSFQIGPFGNLYESEYSFQKLKEYVGQIYPDISQSKLNDEYQKEERKLIPYEKELSELATKWNLVAPWAGEALLSIDIENAKNIVLESAGVADFFKFSVRQASRLIGQDGNSFPSEDIPISMWELLSYGGRSGTISQIRERLARLEKTLKNHGAIELPSALSKHAKWWFDRYVYKVSFNDIANAFINEEGSPTPQHVKAAVNNFSRLAAIYPRES